MKLMVKDFSVGQKAYILYLHHGYNQAPEIIEVHVKKVGKKYITVNSYNKRFERRDDIDGLSEYCDFGEIGYLFTSYEAAETEKKRHILMHNIRTYSNYLYKCSYEELRTIMNILKKAGECR